MNPQIGDIVVFSYYGVNIHDRMPKILYLGQVGHLMHGLNMHYLTVAAQLKLRDMFKKTRLQLDPNKSDYIGNDPIRFYNLKIKPFIETTSKNPYRTYNVASVRGLSVVDSYLRGNRVGEIIKGTDEI